METKTYLIKSDYDHKTKKLVQVDGNTLTIQFRIMDNYSMVEIKGRLKDRGIEEFTHQILCHKDQDLTILRSWNDQIDHVSNIDAVNKRRINVDNSLVVQREPIMGLHGEDLNKQVDLEELIKEQS
tara:strand:- start:53 stop:430 length:378 start_codon:yes stop_codon:yes gene_type:complete